MAVVENVATRNVILKALQDNDINADVCDSDQSGLEHLKRQKFDLVVVDSEACSLTQMLEAVRNSASSGNALIFALIDSRDALRVGSDCGATFAIRKPAREEDISSLILAGYGTMLRERRQYFRCNVTVPVQIYFRNQSVVLARSTNLSAGGMAIEAEFPMQVGTSVEIAFALPNLAVRINTLAQVVWADQRTKAGVRFVNLAPNMQRELDAWLSGKFNLQLQADRESFARCPTLVPALATN